MILALLINVMKHRKLIHLRSASFPADGNGVREFCDGYPFSAALENEVNDSPPGYGTILSFFSVDQKYWLLRASPDDRSSRSLFVVCSLSPYICVHDSDEKVHLVQAHHRHISSRFFFSIPLSLRSFLSFLNKHFRPSGPSTEPGSPLLSRTEP